MCVFFLTLKVFEFGMHLIISGILVLYHSFSVFYIVIHKIMNCLTIADIFDCRGLEQYSGNI